MVDFPVCLEPVTVSWWGTPPAPRLAGMTSFFLKSGFGLCKKPCSGVQTFHFQTHLREGGFFRSLPQSGLHVSVRGQKFPPSQPQSLSDCRDTFTSALSRACWRSPEDLRGVLGSSFFIFTWSALRGRACLDSQTWTRHPPGESLLVRWNGSF